MDCRRTALLALGLLGCTLGCTPQGSGVLASSESRKEPAPEVVKEESKLPKRQPKPATCVAMGEYREQESGNPDYGPAGQAKLREEARMAYQQAINIDPNYVPGFKALARLYTASSDHARAVATYEQALKGHPKDAGLHFEFGMCLARHKDWPQALEHLKAAHDLDPADRTFANTLAFTLARIGRFDESLIVFTQAVGEAQACYNVAKAQHHLQRNDLSMQYTLRAIQLDPTNAQARDLLAELTGTRPAGQNPIAQIGFETDQPVADPGQ